MYSSLDRQCTVNGVEYEVIKVLDNNLLLVVEKEKFSKEEFPLQTFVVQDDWYINQVKEMEK